METKAEEAAPPPLLSSRPRGPTSAPAPPRGLALARARVLLVIVSTLEIGILGSVSDDVSPGGVGLMVLVFPPTSSIAARCASIKPMWL